MKAKEFGTHRNRCFVVLSALLSLSAMVGLLNAQLKLETTNCTKTPYCPHYGCSCVELYNVTGGMKNNSQFQAAYPCCVCDPSNSETCMCAKGGTITRFFGDLSKYLPPGLPPVGSGGLTIERGNFDGNQSTRVANCVGFSDCESDDDCRARCCNKSTTANEGCCVCLPLGRCDNCFCARGNVLIVTTVKYGNYLIGNRVTLVYPRTLSQVVNLIP